jgi:hypothetical protein
MGEWIYFSNESDNGWLYKIKVDGTGKVKLNSNRSNNINIVDDWIFYDAVSAEYAEQYKIKLDGTGDSLVR